MYATIWLILYKVELEFLSPWILKRAAIELVTKGQIMHKMNVPNTSTNEVDLWSQTSSSVDLGDISTQSWVTNSHTQTPSWTESSTSGRPASTNKMLSGTNEYFGVLDIVDILGTSPQFTLQDAKWNYFVYYGDHLNFVQTIQNLGGNIYEMKTETEIIQNQLFWDKVSYINLSQLQDLHL